MTAKERAEREFRLIDSELEEVHKEWIRLSEKRETLRQAHHAAQKRLSELSKPRRKRT